VHCRSRVKDKNRSRYRPQREYHGRSGHAGDRRILGNSILSSEKKPLNGMRNEIQKVMREATREDPELEALGRHFTSQGAKRLKGLPLDRIEIAKRRPRYERLDQLVVELLLGVR
jgi:hypothetical protein